MHADLFENMGQANCFTCKVISQNEGAPPLPCVLTGERGSGVRGRARAWSTMPLGLAGVQFAQHAPRKSANQTGSLLQAQVWPLTPNPSPPSTGARGARRFA